MGESASTAARFAVAVGRRRASKIAIVGGGPAGLFSAALLKLIRPANEVTTFERDHAGSTYGWGVVLSENGLRAVQAADPLTHTRLTAQQTEFDSIEVRHRGQAIHSTGHVYSAIGRHKLLAILRRRCQELGVDMRYETEIGRLSELADFDVVVGADGVRSVVRQSAQEHFEPRVESDEMKYVWLGTRRRFDALTFSVRESEHGWFHAHFYPYDRDLSTFVVFCSETTWRRAGLDAADESGTIARCEEVFALDLEGARLLSNRSVWSTFQNMVSDRWHHGNVVLVGDAAHTTHPTIGSGTKLALEDAAALAHALGDGRDPDAAFRRYERERRPVAARFQEAAAQSRECFENLERYVQLEAPDFAYHLLARTDRGRARLAAAGERVG